MRTGILDGAAPAATQAEGQAPQLDRAPKLAPARRRWVGPVLGLVIILVGLGSFWIGRYPVSPALVLDVLAHKLGFGEQYWDPTVETVIVNVRLPRIALAMLVGGALATSGAGFGAAPCAHTRRRELPRLLVTSLGVGALFLLLIDNVIRGIEGVELPLGVLAALVGTPVFVMLLARVRRGWL